MSSSPDAARAAFDFEQLAPPPEAARALRVEDAAARGRSIVATAEAEAVRIRDAARAQGYEEGLAAGRVAAREELQPGLLALAEAVAGLRELEQSSADRVEREAVELAMQVAERVVAGALDAQPGRILDVLRGALRSIVERERLVIQVNPADLDLVRDGMAELTSSLGGIEHVEVQEERRVHRGGAVVRTVVGEVDARLETKLERARAAVVEELGR
jgi:flagellar assembly protein FliH